MKAAEERWFEMQARLAEGEVRLSSNADFMRDLMIFGQSATLISVDEAERIPPEVWMGMDLAKGPDRSIQWFVTWADGKLIYHEPKRNGCPTCGCDECGCNTRRKPMGCHISDCDGCMCPSGHPPCGHCTDHGIDLERCDQCGCDICGCTPERAEIRANVAAYPELMP